MKKTISVLCLVFIFSACSTTYNYKSTHHTPAVLFDTSELAENIETWEFYVHDGYGRSHKGHSISIDSSSLNTVVERPQPVDLPRVLKPSEYNRKNEIHVFVNKLNLDTNTHLKFLKSDIKEVIMYSDPEKSSESNEVPVKSIITTVFIILGIVLASIGIAALLIWLAIQSFLSSIGCYIATMAYGSYNAPEVMVLRRFRDERLKKTFFGRVFIANYYAFSPLLVKFVQKTGFADRFIRRKLDSFVDRLRTKNNW